MADSDDSMLDKAEGVARRLLERLGAKVDSKMGATDKEVLSPREVGELTSRIERTIESHLREDKNGTKRVAPNRFQVLFTYEETSRLNTKYIEALGLELKASIYEYINNRRYEVRGPFEVKTGRDLFAKTTVVKAFFEGDTAASNPVDPVSDPPPQPGGQPAKPSTDRRVSLRTSDGQSFIINLKPGGAPAHIGRASNCAIRIDDASISRMHCSVTLRSNGDIVIADLGSSNGTSLNNQMLGTNEARSIDTGDTIGVGDIILNVAEIE